MLDDDHFPLLLVRETLDFVAQLTATEERVDDLLEGLGLAHVAETVVGGKELKGVSGGQKRRVSVGEALLCNATFYLLDSITNGLDSLTSFSLVQAIGEQAKGSANGQAYGAMISLLQPSDELIKLFKNIMVMNTDGTLAYFGPVDTVEAYFSSIVKRDASISLNDYILATVVRMLYTFLFLTQSTLLLMRLFLSTEKPASGLRPCGHYVPDDAQFCRELSIESDRVYAGVSRLFKQPI